MDISQWISQMAIGSLLTIELFFVTIIISIPFGLCITFLYISEIKIINKLCGFYILIMRGTPLLLQIFFIYYGLPSVPFIGKYLIFDRFQAGAVAFILNYAAYFAEIFRGGLLSIDKGQYEASKVLGLSDIQTKLKIIFPQMFRVSLPAISNEAIILVKDTALITTLGLSDLLNVTKTIVNSTTNVTPFIVAAVFYLLMSYVLTIFFRKLEIKFSYEQ